LGIAWHPSRVDSTRFQPRTQIALRALAAKVRYVVDPANPYPRQFTGHVRVTLDDGTVHEHRQSCFKGGVEHPLSDDDMLHKFRANCAVGGLDAAASERLRSRLESLFDLPEIGANALSSNP
jgi:2-methylcitrate dehydratase PrpD